MTLVAAVWGADRCAIERTDMDARWAVADQGFYANPAQFDAFVLGSAEHVHDLALLGARVWAWRVSETVPKGGSEPCVVAMVSLMRRSPGSTHREFVEHWTRNHAPLALRRHVGLHDYHQFVVEETLTDETPEIDGIARLGFVTRADFDERFFDSDTGRAEIMADVARFMDRPGRETTLVGPVVGPAVGPAAAPGAPDPAG